MNQTGNRNLFRNAKRGSGVSRLAHSKHPPPRRGGGDIGMERMVGFPFVFSGFVAAGVRFLGMVGDSGDVGGCGLLGGCCDASGDSGYLVGCWLIVTSNAFVLVWLVLQKSKF